MSTTTRPGIRAARAARSRRAPRRAGRQGSARNQAAGTAACPLTAPGKAGEEGEPRPPPTHHRTGPAYGGEVERRPSPSSSSASPHAAAPADGQGGPAAAVAVAGIVGQRHLPAPGPAGPARPRGGPAAPGGPPRRRPGPARRRLRGGRTRGVLHLGLAAFACVAGSTPATGRRWRCRCRRTTSWPTTSRWPIPLQTALALSPVAACPRRDTRRRAAPAVGVRRPGPPAAPGGRPEDRGGRLPRHHAARRLQAAGAQRQPGRARRRVHQRSRAGRGRTRVRRQPPLGRHGRQGDDHGVALRGGAAAVAGDPPGRRPSRAPASSSPSTPSSSTSRSRRWPRRSSRPTPSAAPPS